MKKIISLTLICFFICGCEIAGESTGFATLAPFGFEELEGNWESDCYVIGLNSNQSTISFSENTITWGFKTFTSSTVCNPASVSLELSSVMTYEIGQKPASTDRISIDYTYISSAMTIYLLSTANTFSALNYCNKNDWSTIPGLGNPYDIVSDTNCTDGRSLYRNDIMELKNGILILGDSVWLYPGSYKEDGLPSSLETITSYTKQ